MKNRSKLGLALVLVCVFFSVVLFAKGFFEAEEVKNIVSIPHGFELTNSTQAKGPANKN